VHHALFFEVKIDFGVVANQLREGFNHAQLLFMGSNEYHVECSPRAYGWEKVGDLAGCNGSITNKDLADLHRWVGSGEVCLEDIWLINIKSQ
jgi:hypothetical protein